MTTEEERGAVRFKPVALSRIYQVGVDFVAHIEKVSVIVTSNGKGATRGVCGGIRVGVAVRLRESSSVTASRSADNVPQGVQVYASHVWSKRLGVRFLLYG